MKKCVRRNYKQLATISQVIIITRSSVSLVSSATSASASALLQLLLFSSLSYSFTRRGYCGDRRAGARAIASARARQ